MLFGDGEPGWEGPVSDPSAFEVLCVSPAVLPAISVDLGLHGWAALLGELSRLVEVGDAGVSVARVMLSSYVKDGPSSGIGFKSLHCAIPPAGPGCLVPS
jgi:hypothetical protein